MESGISRGARRIGWPEHWKPVVGLNGRVMSRLEADLTNGYGVRAENLKGFQAYLEMVPDHLAVIFSPLFACG